MLCLVQKFHCNFFPNVSIDVQELIRRRACCFEDVQVAIQPYLFSYSPRLCIRLLILEVIPVSEAA